MVDLFFFYFAVEGSISQESVKKFFADVINSRQFVRFLDRFGKMIQLLVTSNKDVTVCKAYFNLF